MDNKPTEEQLKRFWTWRGFRQATKDEVCAGCNPLNWWRYPDKQQSQSFLPDLDLNNLYKYAVPKLFTSKYSMYSVTFTRNGAELETHHEDKYSSGVYHETWDDKEYALALFWAIYKLIEDDKEVQ